MDIIEGGSPDHPLFRLQPIDPAAVTAARESGVDPSGNPVARQPAGGGEPLRCCLRDARAGEDLILFGYRPALAGGPYIETGAVFAHAAPCPGPPAAGPYPTEWVGRPQVLRAYDERGWIHPASTLHDGSDPAAAIAAVLAQPGVVGLDSRNVVYGCFMVAAVPR